MPCALFRGRMPTLPLAAGAFALVAGVAALVPLADARAPRRARPAIVAPAAAAGHYRFDPFGTVAAYRPAGRLSGVALFLSGDGGWNRGMVRLTRQLTDQGVAVAGVSTPALLKRLDASRACVNPNFALAALAQDFEHRLNLPGYVKPIVAGYSSGATIAYAALAQAPAGTYRGAVSLGFGPDVVNRRRWCAIPGVAVTRTRTAPPGWLFAPAPRLPAPWVVLQGQDDQVVSAATARAFTARVAGARLIELPQVGHGFAAAARWAPQFRSALAPLLAPAQADADVGDLPLTPVIDPAARATDTMAVLYSGDGGWAGLDRDVAARLAAAGVPVVGMDSLRYFWNARTPQGAGADAGRIVAHYSRLWHRPRVIFVGYSFGADDLPYIVGNLPASVRSMVARTTMLGLGPSADFQFHLASWLDIAGQGALPTAPAIARLRGLPMQCVRGARETDSQCAALAPGLVQDVVLDGGHHFGGDADAVARTVLAGLIA